MVYLGKKVSNNKGIYRYLVRNPLVGDRKLQTNIYLKRKLTNT